MSDDQYDDDPDFDDNPDESSVIKQLRKQTRDQAAELKALRETAERATKIEAENNLFKANLGNLSEAQQKAVLATAAEVTAEALRSQAELLGFVEPAAPAVPAEDLGAYDRVAAAQAGGETPGGGDYDTEVAAARNPDELRAVMARFNRLPDLVE